jgi:hypothetical protein
MSAHNLDGSHASNGVVDNATFPLKIGPEQPVLHQQSMLDNPGTDGGDDRYPAPIPMYPYGREGDGDSLFSLDPRRKG